MPPEGGRADVGIGPYKTLCSQSVGVDAHIDPCRESGLFAGLRMFRKIACTVADFGSMPPKGGRADVGIGPYKNTDNLQERSIPWIRFYFPSRFLRRI